MCSEQGIRRLSTKTVPRGERLDYWMGLVRDFVWPVSDWSGISPDFAVDLQEARLGCLTTVYETMQGAPHSRRTRSDVENSTDTCYCLFTTDAPVDWVHNGHSEHLASGDVVLLGQGEHDSHMQISGFRSNILKLPGHWLESWLPEPKLLVGRKIPRHSRWGQVLSPMVRQLTPELATAPPLPHAVLVDQVGITLALIVGEAEAEATPDLVNKIQDQIRQRCFEPQLTAAHVASSLSVPPQILHRALAANKLTFASLLLDARTGAALQMLTSPSFAQLTTVEIARHAGFLSASHFARAICKRTGHTPLHLRRSAY